MLAAGAVSAAQDVNQIKPLRVQRNIVAVKESTTKVRPQIDERYVERERESSENLPPPIDIRPIWEGNTLPVGTVGNFGRTSPGMMFPGIGATGWNPPDPNIAVGNNHIVEIVNSSIAFFNKNTGVKTFQQVITGSAGFFGALGAGNFVFDPKAYFDPMSGRFFVVALELDSGTLVSKLCIGVSDDGDPTGTWFKYRVEAKLVVGANQYWMDYPSFGFNKDAVVVCGNMFALPGSSGFGGVEFVVMPKAQMITGAPITATVLVDAGAGSAQMAQCKDPTVAALYGMTVSTTTAFKVYAITGLPSAPVLTSKSATVAAFTPLSRDAISTAGRTLWTVDSRLFNLVWRGGKLYTTHHVSASSSDNRNMVRWYEFNTNNWPAVPSASPILLQAGNVPGGAGQDTFFPAINVNKVGDISLTFGRSSSSITGDMMICSRRISDPPGTMSAPTTFMSSSNPNYGGAGQNRWGDYFSTQVDPVDDLKFWGVGMVGGSTGQWVTHIASWTVSTGVGTSYLPLSVSTYQGVFLSGTLVSILSSDNLKYNVKSVPLTSLGQVAAIEVTYKLDKPVSELLSLTAKVEASSSSASTGMIWLKNQTSGEYEHIKSFQMQTTDKTNSLALAGNMSRYISPTGDISMIFRALIPDRAGPGLQFSQNTDLIHLVADWR